MDVRLQDKAMIYKRDIDRLSSENARLRSEVADLKRRLGENTKRHANRERRR